MPDWKKIKAEYIRGGTSYRKLAAKYGVSFSALTRKAAKEKWTDLRRKSDEKASTKIVESVAAAEAKRVDKFHAVADKLLQQIEAAISDGTVVLSGRGWRDVTGAIKDLMQIKGVQNAADEQEQIARIEKLRKDIAGEETAKEIRVTIESGLDEYGG